MKNAPDGGKPVALLLAAGKGSRLGELTANRPKCLVAVNGTTILDKQIAGLKKKGINDIYLVCGYQRDVLIEYCQKQCHEFKFHFVNNDMFEKTNSMYSLLLGLESVLSDKGETDVIVLETDIFFVPEILDFTAGDGLTWLGDAESRIFEGSYLTRGDKENVTNIQIIRDVKNIQANMLKSLGIYHIRRPHAQTIGTWLRDAVREGKANLYLDLIMAEHIGDIPIQCRNVHPNRWVEIDTPEDLAMAERLFEPPGKRSRSYGQVKKYFDSSPEEASHIDIAALGTGESIEIPYRHYWEFNNFKKLLPPSLPLNILELGCGAGRWALSLLPMAQSYVGVDISATQLEVARRALAEYPGAKVRLVEADVAAFEPLGDERFTLIYTSGVSQYLHDRELSCLIRKLKKHFTQGGIWIDRSTVVTERERLVRDEPEYFSIYRTPRELTEIFREAGFSGTNTGRSYRILQPLWFWRKRIVRLMTHWGEKHAPAQAFKAMERISALAEWYRGEAGRGADGIMYSYDFFLFSLERA
jgi:choline kinase/SAM-dependent methyltransferase